MSRLIPLFLCIATLVGCATQPPQQEVKGRLGSVGYKLTESAHDGSYDVPSDKSFTVDPDSRLELRFEVASTSTPSAADPRWVAINAWLEETTALSKRLVELNRRTVDVSDAQALRQLQQEVTDFNKEVLAAQGAATKILETAGLKPDQVRAVLLGTFDGKRDSVIRNVTRWTIQQRDDLISTAKSKQAGREQQVVVMAFHQVAGQTRERLHVEHYDTISSGEDLALKRTALGLTERQLADLNMQIEQSERAARAIRQLTTDRGALAKLRDQIHSKLDAKLAELQQSVEATADTIRAQLKAAVEHVKAAQNNTALDPRIRSQVEVLRGQIEQLQKDWEAVADVKGNIESIRKAPQSGDISTLLFGDASVVKNLTAIDAAIHILDSWPSKISTIETQARQVATALTEAKLQDVLPVDFKNESEKLRAAVEPIAVFIEGLTAREGEEAIGRNVEALASAGDETVPRKLDDLQPARIDLRTYRFEENDGVMLRVELHESAAPRTDTPKQVNEYHLDVREQGWYQRITGIPIFARASSGTEDAKKWKPNIGVTAAWYYRERFPTGFGEFLNWLEPGIGIHAASLDQGEESVEFGLGVNVSFWKGLLTLGVGKNLSANGKGTYFLLGSDLFRLLGKLEPSK